jgi:hypothetical protein
VTQDPNEETERIEPDLKKELSSIWRSTLDQLDEIKNAIVKSGDVGRGKLDAAFLARQRDKLLSELGRAWIDQLAADGAEPPEALSAKVERVKELDEQIVAHEEEFDRFIGREDEATNPGTESDESP